MKNTLSTDTPVLLPFRVRNILHYRPLDAHLPTWDSQDSERALSGTQDLTNQHYCCYQSMTCLATGTRCCSCSAVWRVVGLVRRHHHPMTVSGR